MTQVGAVEKAVNKFGADAKAKLNNMAATGQPEDQLRGPLEALMATLEQAAGIAGEVVLVGGTSFNDLKTRLDYSIPVGQGKAM